MPRHPRHPDRRLIRYLHGELPASEVRQLRADLARDPALQARLAELDRLWQGLQQPPPAPAPFGYVPRLQRLADEKRASAAASLIGWSAAPPAVRALAGAALVAGIALGIGLGRLPQPAGAPPQVSAPAVAPAPEPAEEPGPGPAMDAPPAAAVVTVAPQARQVPPAASHAAGDSEAAEGSPLGGGGTLAEAYLEALGGAALEGEESGARW